MIGKTKERSVITFATNKKSYFELALNCARSILLHNQLKIYIVTNLEIDVPSDLKEFVFKLQADSQHAKLGIGIKLYTDLYLQTEETLFIDSDCLCFADLSPIFDACNSKEMTVVGTLVEAEVFCGKEQAQTIRENFNIDQLIRFNGGFYYLKKSETCTSIFNLARSIIPNYDEFGFHRIGGVHINEEGPISIAMVLNSQTPVIDDGRYITDLYTTPRPHGLNVLKGERTLNNPKIGFPKHRNWYVDGDYSPILLHFGGNSLNSFPYNKQNMLLYLNRKGIPNWISSCISTLIIEVPYSFYYKLCTFFRK